MARSLKNMMGAGLGAESASLINGVVIDGLVATGSSQADALLLSSDVNVVGTADPGTGVRLRATPQPGDECVVANLGANALNVYPSLGGSIQAGALNSAYQLAVGAAASFVARSGSLNWAVLSSGGQGVVGPTLGTLTFSATTFTVGTSSSGTIIGATATSTITASGLPTGLTINSAARTWAWDGTGTASTGNVTLTETLAGATNTPHNSTVSYTISAATTINAPTYALSTASGVSPASWNVTGDSTFQPGMYVHQRFAVSGTSFATPVPGAPSVDYYTQIEGSDWEANSDSIGNGLVTFVQPTGEYDTDCRLETVPGDATNNVVSPWSNTVTDTIAPPLILNGTFTDSSAWTLGSGVTISGGVCNASGSGAICQQPVTYVSGGTYQLDFDYQSSSGSGTGKLRANLSSTNGADIVATSSTLTFDFATHHITLTFTANVTSGYMSIEADTAAYSGWIDNVTLVRTA